MRTRFFLTTALFILLVVGFAKVEVDVNHFSNEMNAFQTESTDNVPGIIVKGMLYEGEVIPAYDLPEVQIVGERNPEHLTKAVVYNGEIIPAVDLDEVVIRPV